MILCHLDRGVSHRKFPREANVEGGLRLHTRRTLLQQVIPKYREASTVKKKSKLLDAFTATTRYNRKYTLWLLNDDERVLPTRADRYWLLSIPMETGTNKRV